MRFNSNQEEASMPTSLPARASSNGPPSRVSIVLEVLCGFLVIVVIAAGIVFAEMAILGDSQQFNAIASTLQ
jgi:hypothetical protein